MTRRGAFIVFEGLDRCGKTTQVEQLAEALRGEGKEVRCMKFPDRTTPIGQTINAYLLSQTEMDDRAIHLLFAANRWECAKAIEDDLAKGITIIADRYAFSGIAFSAAKGLDRQWLSTPDTSLPAPDLIIYLSLATDKAALRSAYGEERYESLALQARVKEEFELVKRRVGEFAGRSGTWVDVNADGTVECVAARIRGTVEGLRGELAEVKRLWV
ncbi:Thymidylate kinase [Naganishia albida]|nr:Thymidylate kinase [Naganishia albida]